MLSLPFRQSFSDGCCHCYPALQPTSASICRCCYKRMLQPSVLVFSCALPRLIFSYSTTTLRVACCSFPSCKRFALLFACTCSHCNLSVWWCRCAFSFHFCHRKDVSIISTMNGLSKWCTTDGLSRQSSVISCGGGCCPAPALM